MTGILDRLSDWLLPTLPNPLQDDYAIISEPGSNMAHLVPQFAFINHASAMQECYVSKLPLAAPEAPLSRQLLNSRKVASLESKPLSLVIGEAMRTGLISRNPTNSEFFCWSLMDHVTLYPYVHPDGYVRGTREFQDWRLSIQKQYAILLHKQFVLRERLSTLYELINNSAQDYLGPRARPAVDMYGREQPAKMHPMQKKLEEVEKENLDVCCKVDRFRAEQKMLQKAYLRVVEVCSAEGLLVPANIWSKASRNPVTILRSLNRAHKRRAEEVILPRSSASRNRPGHKFSRQQKKQLKVSSEVPESPKTVGKTKTVVHEAEDGPNSPEPATTTDSDSIPEVEHNDSESEEDDAISVEGHSLSNEDSSESAPQLIGSVDSVEEHETTVNEHNDHTPTSSNESLHEENGPCSEIDIAPSYKDEATLSRADIAPPENNIELPDNGIAPIENAVESIGDKLAPIEDESTPIEDCTGQIDNEDTTLVESDDATSSEEWHNIEKEHVELYEDAGADRESSPDMDAISDQSITLVPTDLLAEELVEHLKIEKKPTSTPQKQDTDSSIDDLDSVLSELSKSKDLVQGVRDDFAEQLQQLVQLDMLEDLEATLTGLQWEFEYVSSVQDEIKKVLEAAPTRGELTAEGIAKAIPESGVDYIDLIDLFEDRVSDDQAGFAMLRELIDEAGFVDEVSRLVYKRGPVEFGDIQVD